MKSYLMRNSKELLRWFTDTHKMGDAIFPFTIQVFKGISKHRSLEQNNLIHVWYRSIAKQLGDQTPEDVKRECKLRFGVPILRADSEYFSREYDKLIEHRKPPFQYWEKLEAMDLLPVTSLMNTTQMSEYMEAVYYSYTQDGKVELEWPDET